VSVSVDRGKTWLRPVSIANGTDLTDVVKGRRGYRPEVRAEATTVADSGLTVTTVPMPTGKGVRTK
jgi:hypothetical protein